jgi:phenylalanyl-tRNA synthetase beta chain
MKFTFSWLKEFLDTAVTADNVAVVLNKIGLEVDDFMNCAEKYADFNCVQVTECRKHPDSDHLHICRVKTTNGELDVVCGAPNVRNGMKTALAPIGSVLPNGMEIKKSKIRGVESCGMLCSEKELGISDDHSGILELGDAVEIGDNIGDIYNLNDAVFEISITPNRNDSLCVYGIARELSVAGLGSLKELEKQVIQGKFDSKVKLSVRDENCPFFSFREIRGLKNGESPKWLKNRLLSVGINPKNALVDVSNYVMLCFNNPLHCYDASKIDGEINLRSAEDNEEFVDLFNKTHRLNKGNTVIEDGSKKICLAGIIGAESSLSSLETTGVIVECAIFDPINTAKTGRQLNIQTDSRYRFERGVDCGMTQFILDYACKLIVDICGGEISNVVRYEKDGYKESLTKIIDLPTDKIEKLLGIKIGEDVIIDILTKQKYKITQKDNVLRLEVPTWKNNIVVKEDIIDDIIRFYGYEHLEDDDFRKIEVFENDKNFFFKKLESKLYMVRKKLGSNGMFEVISYSFSKRKDNELFTKTTDKLELLNPIISDLSYMRQNILINLINIVKKNNNRSFENLSFFEVGNLFTVNDLDKEKLVIGGIRSGQDKDKSHYGDERAFDVYDVKKDMFDTLSIFSVDADKLLLTREVPSYYHNGHAGAVLLGKKPLGYFGELHPNIVKEFDLKQKIVVFEVFVDNIPSEFITKGVERKSYIANDVQSVERSFAFTVDKNVDVGDILKKVSASNKTLISEVRLFDIYQDEKNSDEKSVAFTVTIQPTEKSLSKEEIDKLSDVVINTVKDSCNGRLRDGKTS